MNTKIKLLSLFLAAAALMCLTSCKHDPEEQEPTENEEIYAGGRLGTTFNSSASAYEDPTPAVENAGLVSQFKYGEYFFERTITQNSSPFNGLGPV